MTLVSPAVVAGAAAGSTADVEAAATDADAELEHGARVYNVRRHGARGDGQTLDTAAVQAAIDACHRDGGGTVLVPAGDFLIGTIELKSHVTLHLAAQGRLLGSPNAADYAAGRDVPARNTAHALVYASKAQNVAIEGRGTIDGNGRDFLKNRAEAGGRGVRPHTVIFSGCTDVLMRDVFVTRSPHHAIRFLLSERVRVDGVRIYNRGGSNNDGFHFASVKHVHVSNCDVVCQDDACALFGSCQFVTVTNCHFTTRWSVFRFGGGDARNITVSNCVIYETYGCPIKMACRAGSHYEDMVFSNLILQDVTGPISLNLDPHDMSGAGGGGDLEREKPATAGDGVIRNILIDGIRGRVIEKLRPYPDHPHRDANPGELRQCIVLNGIKGAHLENITISNVHLTFDGGGTADEAARTVPEAAGEYFRIGTPPAYGLYARNVRGLTVSNVRFETAKPDLRPAVVLDHVSDAAIHGLAAQGHPDAPALLRFVETRDVLVTGARVLSPAAAFLLLDGAGHEGILVDGGDLRRAKTPLALQGGASETAVRVRS